MSIKKPASLHLLPNLLQSESMNWEKYIPVFVKDLVAKITVFAVENEKNARRYIRILYPEVDYTTITFYSIHHKSLDKDLRSIIHHLKSGVDVGVLSDAGLPAIADPGSRLVDAAHANGVKVVPHVGPSSLFLALMASGFNGQSFAFLGYLPIDKIERKKAIHKLLSNSPTQTQIFMETPYRNDALIEDLFKFAFPDTPLCIAADLDSENEWIQTKTIQQWQTHPPKINKTPCVFLIGLPLG